MTCSQSWSLAGLLLCSVFAGNAFLMLTFLRYCELMAKCEGRQAEWAEIRSDENGLNAYKTEQWKKLAERPYLGFTDPELHSKGEKLVSCLPAMFALTLMAILATVVLDTCFCK